MNVVKTYVLSLEKMLKNQTEASGKTVSSWFDLKLDSINYLSGKGITIDSYKKLITLFVIQVWIFSHEMVLMCRNGNTHITKFCQVG